MPSDQYISIDGHRTWTATEGAGRHIVLCHGGPGCWDDLGDLAAMLSDGATVHRYDQRACGRSGGPSPTTMQELVDELAALRIAWGAERWIVSGHSAGAALALLYAAQFPARTDAVIYISGTGLDWTQWRNAYYAAIDARLTPEQRAERDRLQPLVNASPRDRELHDAFCRLQWSADFADRSHALELADRLLERGLLVNFDVNRDVNADWSAIRIDAARRHQLESVSQPVLIVHGDADPRPVAAVEPLAHRLPNAHLEVIPNAGHYPWIENAAATRDALRAFVASLT